MTDKKEIELSIIERNGLAIAAFRYALGKDTYITKTVSDALIKMNQKRLLNYWTKELMLEELHYALINNKAGTDNDKKNWRALYLELIPNNPDGN